MAESEPTLPTVLSLELALSTADKIDNTNGKTEAIQDIANALANNGMTDQANPVLDDMVRATKNISD